MSISMSGSGSPLRSSLKLEGSMRVARSKEPSVRSNASSKSKCRALVSNWKASLRASVSTENREAISSMLFPAASKGSPVSTLMSGSASCWRTISLLAA